MAGCIWGMRRSAAASRKRLASRYPEIVTFGRKGLYKYLTTDTATEMALRLRDHLFSWEALSTEARYAAYQEIRGSWNN